MARLRNIFGLFCLVCAALSTSAIAQITEISNITSTPIAGSGHDYLHDLSEIVDPANGSVSIRVAAPAPQRRGTKYAIYAYSYDTNGQFLLTFTPALNTSWNEMYVTGPYITSPYETTGNTHYNFGAGTVTYQWTVIDYCSDPLGSGGCGTTVYCSYSSGFIATDPSGGRHDLGVGVEMNGGKTPEDCSNVGVFLYSAGGDEEYKIDATCYSNNAPTLCGYASAGTAVVDLGGDANISGLEDTNGNYLNTDGRSWTSPFSYYFAPNEVTPTSLTIPGVSPYTYGAQSGTSGSLYASGGNPLSATIRYNPQASIDEGNDCRVPTSAYLSTGGLALTGGASSVTLPNGKEYKFTYDSTYGYVKTITYPTGATVQYTWALDPQSEVSGFQGTGLAIGQLIAHGQTCVYTVDMPRLKSRVVSYDGVTPALEQDFVYTTQWNTNYSTWGASNAWTRKTTTVTTTDLIRPGHPNFKTIYTYVPMANARQMVGASTTFPVPLMPVESTVVYQDTTAKVLRTVTKAWNTPDQLAAECVTLDNGQTSGTFYQYAQYSWGSVNSVSNNTSRATYTGLVTDKVEYDYGSVTSPCTQPSTTPIRETKTTYASLGALPYWPNAPGIVNRPQTVQTYGNGTLAAETDYAYDQTSLTSVSPAPYGHDETNYGPSATTSWPRGNPTTITKKCFAGTASCTNSVWKIAYDTTGQPVKVTDANGNITTISYADSFQSGTGTPPQPTNEYATKVTRPTTNGVAHIETFKWNYNQGELAVLTDENGKNSFYYYNDPWDRPTEADYPDGGVSKHVYNDSPPVSVTTCRLISGSASAACSQSSPPVGWQTAVAVMDGVGHVTNNEAVSDPDGITNAPTTYDGLGRRYQAYNPTRCATPTTNCGETTWGETTFTYDALDRITNTTEPDGSAITAAYSGNCSTVTDESGNARKSCSDAMGRLTGVWEDPAALNYATGYTYDALNNLLSVTQNGSNASQARVRTFSYDSLSHLLCAANPEIQNVTCPASPTGTFPSGAITYSYDGNGNVLTKTAPMPNQTSTTNVITTYQYDPLNRLLSKGFASDTAKTPWSCYQYDVASTGIGRLANEWTQSSSVGKCATALPSSGVLTKRSISAYDTMGRPLGEQQCTPFNCSSTTPYALSYSYDLAGNLGSYTNGIGNTPGASSNPLTFTNCFGGAGRLQTTTSNWIDSTHPQSLFSTLTSQSSTCPNSSSPTVSSPAYASSGAIENAFYGTGLQLLRSYDGRLRITGEQDTGGH